MANSQTLPLTSLEVYWSYLQQSAGNQMGSAGEIKGAWGRERRRGREAPAPLLTASSTQVVPQATPLSDLPGMGFNHANFFQSPLSSHCWFEVHSGYTEALPGPPQMLSSERLPGGKTHQLADGNSQAPSYFRRSLLLETSSSIAYPFCCRVCSGKGSMDPHSGRLESGDFIYGAANQVSEGPEALRKGSVGVRERPSSRVWFWQCYQGFWMQTVPLVGRKHPFPIGPLRRPFSTFLLSI